MDDKGSLDSFDVVLNRNELLDDSRKDTITVDRLDEYLNKEPQETGRTRIYLFSYLMNEMGYESVGGPFYEGYTEYPAYEPDYMMQTGYIYD